MATFIHPQTLKAITFTYDFESNWFLNHWIHFVKIYKRVTMWTFYYYNLGNLEIKSQFFFHIKSQKLTYFLYENKIKCFHCHDLKKEVRCVKIFKPIWGRTFSKDFFNMWKVMCARSILPKNSLLMTYVGKPNHVFYTWWNAMPSNKSWIHFEFMSWFLCKNHKNEYLCCIIFASPLAFVGCVYLLWLCRLDCQSILNSFSIDKRVSWIVCH